MHVSSTKKLFIIFVCVLKRFIGYAFSLHPAVFFISQIFHENFISRLNYIMFLFRFLYFMSIFLLFYNFPSFVLHIFHIVKRLCPWALQKVLCKRATTDRLLKFFFDKKAS